MDTKKICAILYWILLTYGAIAACVGNLPVALFIAITCAGESIGTSIDQWPKFR